MPLYLFTILVEYQLIDKPVKRNLGMKGTEISETRDRASNLLFVHGTLFYRVRIIKAGTSAGNSFKGNFKRENWRKNPGFNIECPSNSSKY